MQSLLKIMNELREKCPWDAKQTIHSLRQLTIEETYELTEEIDKENWQGIKEELGDLLLHIVFYCKIAEEKNEFLFADVVKNINEKLIRRHPHIYSNVVVKDEEEVKYNWEQIKLKEGKGNKTVLSGVPKGLPAILKAMRIQEKAKQVGFEWENKNDVWDKIEEENNELLEAIENKNKEEIKKEFGDVLFSYINFARFLDIDAEAALESTNQKFIDRFSIMEKLAKEKELNFASLTLMEQEELWQKAKSISKY